MASIQGNSMLTFSAVALAISCIAISVWVNSHVHEMYMDEPFHVRQTQRYCEGDFHTWDPKITTFPGLYFFGLALARCKHILFQTPMSKACSTTTLRSINLYGAVGCFLLFYRIHRLVHDRAPSSQSPSTHPTTHISSSTCSLLTALLLATYPTHFFYTFLYYTDIGSTALLLFTYLLTLQHTYTAAAFAGALAVLFRQTNAVWVTFILFAAIQAHIASHLQSPPPRTPKPTSQKSTRSNSQLPPSLLSETASFLASLWAQKAALIPTFLPLLLIPVAFAAFVVHNKGITVGDRQAHTPVKHYMQLHYFAAFAALMTAPVFLSPHTLLSTANTAYKALQRRPLRSLAMLAVAAACSMYMVRHGTLVHPYLVADNRHYTFYVWRKWFARHWSCRYLVVPLYLYSWRQIMQRLQEQRSRLWVVAYLVCTTATLVPAWLLEPRYFTAPYMLLMLHIRPPPAGQLATAVVVNVAVNAVTLYMFVLRPYTWADGSVARFMW